MPENEYSWLAALEDLMILDKMFMLFDFSIQSRGLEREV